MLKRCFIPYIIGASIIALISVSYIGYKAYQRHVEFEGFISDAQALNRFVEGQHSYASKEDTHSSADSRVVSGHDHPTSSGHSHSESEYVYKINGHEIVTNWPLSKEDLELEEWIQTGKLTPYVEQELKRRAAFRRSGEGNVIQRVITPDGKLHSVIVPENSQYEEGDEILESELDPPELMQAEPPPAPSPLLIIRGVEHYAPEEYYSIVDPYERLEYTNKFVASIELGISMEDVEKKIAAGELDVSLSEAEKKMVDEEEAGGERVRSLDMGNQTPPMSDTPPVKVSFLPDNGDTSPGWSRKNEAVLWKSILEDMEGAESVVNESGINEDTDLPPVRSDSPLSPSNLPDMLKPTPSRPSVAELEKQLTPGGIEAELSEGLSPERFDKAQQLIDQYGSEEGLRRLRKSDPEAARRFERHPPVSQNKQEENKGRDAPDGDNQHGSK